MARFNEVTAIRQSNVSTGAAQGMQSLASRLDQFSSQQAQVASQHIAAKAVEAQATGQAQFDPTQELGAQVQDVPALFGQEAQAFNKGLRAAYVAGVDRDLTLSINAAKVKNGTNLPAFNDEVQSLMKGVLDNADASVRGAISQSAADTIDSARLTVQTDTIKKEIADADADLLASQVFYSDLAGTQAFDGDELGASDSLIKGMAVNQGRFDSGQINQAQMVTLNDDMIQESRIQKNRGEVSRVLELPNGIDMASKAILQVQETPLKGMTIEQNDELVKVLTSDLNRFISLQNKQEAADQVTLTQRQNFNYSNLAVDRASGLLNQDNLNKAARRGDINGSQFDKLTAKLESEGVGVSNNEAIFGIQQSIIAGEDMTDVIMNNWGSYINSADARQLITMQQEYSLKESALNTSPAKRARTFMTESMKITGIFGNLTDDAAKKTAEATRLFDERVLADEDPWAIADDMVDRDSLTKLEGTWGRKHDVKNISSAITKLNADTAIAANNAKGNQAEVDNIKNNYNRALQALEQIRDLQLNQQNFDDAMKRAIP